MPYPNEHAARINNPDRYERIRRTNNKFGPGIHAIFGFIKGGGSEVQAIRFDRTKFSPKEAREWLKKHGYKAALEEATKPKEAEVVKKAAWFDRWLVRR